VNQRAALAHSPRRRSTRRSGLRCTVLHSVAGPSRVAVGVWQAVCGTCSLSHKAFLDRHFDTARAARRYMERRRRRGLGRARSLRDGAPDRHGHFAHGKARQGCVRKPARSARVYQRLCTHAHACVMLTRTHEDAHADACMHARAHTHARTHAHKHAQTPARTHMHTHTNQRAPCARTHARTHARKHAVQARHAHTRTHACTTSCAGS
jgi:hypothetical protein